MFRQGAFVLVVRWLTTRSIPALHLALSGSVPGVSLYNDALWAKL